MSKWFLVFLLGVVVLFISGCGENISKEEVKREKEIDGLYELYIKQVAVSDGKNVEEEIANYYKEKEKKRKNINSKLDKDTVQELKDYLGQKNNKNPMEKMTKNLEKIHEKYKREKEIDTMYEGCISETAVLEKKNVNQEIKSYYENKNEYRKTINSKLTNETVRAIEQYSDLRSTENPSKKIDADIAKSVKWLIVQNTIYGKWLLINGMGTSVIYGKDNLQILEIEKFNLKGNSLIAVKRYDKDTNEWKKTKILLEYSPSLPTDNKLNLYVAEYLEGYGYQVYFPYPYAKP